jgi:hypothetical protein
LFCSIGPGPIPWFFPGEITPQNSRSFIQSICNVSDLCVVFVYTLISMPLYDYIGAYSMLILFVIPSIISSAAIYKYLPETNGREIGDIVADLMDH